MRYSESKQDKYSQLAKEAGYPARSIYKLKEIDKAYHIFAKGDRVLDLGSAPGSWMIYIAKRVKEEGRVIGVDTVPLSIQIPSNAQFFQHDVFGDISLIQHEGPFDVIVSDMAPKTSGMRDKDAMASLHVAERAFEIATQCGVRGSHFICKVFESAEFKPWYEHIQKQYQKTFRLRAQASPRGSRELYVIGKERV